MSWFSWFRKVSLQNPILVLFQYPLREALEQMSIISGHENCKNIKNSIFFVLKIAITFLIFYFIFSKVDLKGFTLAFSKINSDYLILAFLIYLSQFLISTLKWQKLVDFFKVKLDLKFYLKLNLIGLFYATVMPGGMFLGDLLKSYKIFRISSSRKVIINSILMDRITGFLGLLVSIIFIYFVIQPNKFPYYPSITLLSAVLLLLIFSFLFFSKKIFTFLLVIIRKFFPKLESFSEKIFRAINTYSGNFGLLLLAVLGGALIYLVSTFCVYFVALAVGINISFIHLLLINCLANFAVIVAPITLFGLGVRDGFFIYFLGFAGVVRESALALSLLLGLIYLSLSLIGGIFEAIDVFFKKGNSQILKAN